MLTKTKIFFLSLSALLISFFTIVIYLNKVDAPKKIVFNQKKDFVKLIAIPDLAIVNESKSNRHRSLETIGDIYSVDGLLIEYDKSSFTLNHGSNI